MKDRQIAVLKRVSDRNGAYHVGEVGDLWAAIWLLALGGLRTRAPWFFYRKSSFPYVGGYVRAKLWLWTTYKGAQMLRATTSP